MQRISSASLNTWTHVLLNIYRYFQLSDKSLEIIHLQAKTAQESTLKQGFCIVWQITTRHIASGSGYILPTK